ncbi:unnamed protein product [Bursaphelenchus xylophilus]|uniref:(pine wood nematode) hypothetical protein n=1 Tax=Bursaphelenchus xylophilus TaxID=6326 RepID=A0A7I8WHJ9_BURXY|nr:unnamed protein product [Bursaphelenchus xylophilus]CAG9109630.1 unnamed protein product [Bursaphelenchus xylophilus]
MMKLWVSVLALLAIVSAVLAYPQTPSEFDAEFARQLIGRAYSALAKTKRSPSMGLSLAEYMASPQGGDNFHFIPSGRK